MVVRVETDEGLVGWGEAHAPYGPTVTQALILDVFAPLLIGQNPMHSEVLWERMYGAQRLRGHNTGYTMEAISGIDIALWDLRGRLRGNQSMLFGWRLSHRNPRATLPVSRAATMLNVKHLPAAILSRLYRGQSCHRSPRSERGSSHGRCRRRSCRSSRTMLVDAHGAYDLGTAVKVGRHLEALGCHWFEDPLVPGITRAMQS